MRVLAVIACLLAVSSAIKCNKCIDVASGAPDGFGLSAIIATYSLEECDSTNANATETCSSSYDKCYSSEATTTYDSVSYVVTSRGQEILLSDWLITSHVT